jgi:small subunit ribosomal protein S16
MVRIRFRRVGARNQASYRIVAADKESPRDGRFLEVLGFYNPRTEPSTIQVDEARLFHWMKHGAQPSDSVVQTLRGIGTWDRWERFKQGEPIETLVEEGLAAIPEVDPRTRRDDLIGKRSKKKRSAAKVKEAEAEAPAGAQKGEPAAKDEAEAAETADEPAETESADEAAAAPEADEPEAEDAAGEASEDTEEPAAEASEAEAEESESDAEGDEPSAEDEATPPEADAEPEAETEASDEAE